MLKSVKHIVLFVRGNWSDNQTGRIKTDFEFADERGTITQLIHDGYKQINVIIVFDAYRVKDAVRKTEKVHGLTVVYTQEAETADQYIELIGLIKESEV